MDIIYCTIKKAVAKNRQSSKYLFKRACSDRFPGAFAFVRSVAGRGSAPDRDRNGVCHRLRSNDGHFDRIITFAGALPLYRGIVGIFCSSDERFSNRGHIFRHCFFSFHIDQTGLCDGIDLFPGLLGN